MSSRLAARDPACLLSLPASDRFMSGVSGGSVVNLVANPPASTVPGAGVPGRGRGSEHSIVAMTHPGNLGDVVTVFSRAPEAVVCAETEGSATHRDRLLGRILCNRSRRGGARPGPTMGPRTVLALFWQRHTCMTSIIPNWYHVADCIEEEASISEVGLRPGLEMGSLGR